LDQDPESNWELAPTGFAALHLWLAWLCSEAFFPLTTQWSDIMVVEPADRPSQGLPAGSAGMVELQLGPKIKSSHTSRATVPVSYQAMLGFHIVMVSQRNNVPLTLALIGP
jgi:hypothetical protein